MGQIETIGKIEGNGAMRIPERTRGPLSSSLETSDIMGAQTSTKGLGVFAHHKRTEFKKTNNIEDIAGSTVGSLRKGVNTKRISNPLDPEYAIPGATEYRENNAFGATGARVMSGTHIPKVQQEFKSQKPIVRMPQNINRDHFKRDVNNFYSTEDRNFADIDFNKLYKATKDPNTGNTAPQIPEHMHTDVSFKRNEKKFYNQSQTEGSEFEYNQHQFYPDTSGGAANLEATGRFTNLGRGTQQVDNKISVPKNSQHFKRDQAQFYGHSYVPSDKSSDRGSIFQNNAAEFYGMEKPGHGEQPFRITSQDLKNPAQSQPKQVSVLNEMRLKEHERNIQRDPKFGKNLKKFWGMKSVTTNSQFGDSQKSYAQKLGGMVGK